MVNTAPIFVVGFPRSGTTLLSAMLSAHSDIASAPETHFFIHMDEYDLEKAVNDEKWPESAVEIIVTKSISGIPLLDMLGVSKSEVSKILTTKEKSKSAILEGLMEVVASREGKKIWLEKTPNHLIHVARIRKLYPHAKIIRIVRDPRDTILSMQKLGWASDSYLINAIRLRERYIKTVNFFKIDKNSICVRYEDLITAPIDTLGLLCDFLEIKFDMTMLDTSNSGKKISLDHEYWKSQVSGKIDRNRIGVWKRELSAGQSSAIAIILNEMIKEFGYFSTTKANINTIACNNMTNRNIINSEELLTKLIIERNAVPLQANFLQTLKRKDGCYFRDPGIKGTLKSKIYDTINLLSSYNIITFSPTNKN